MMRKNPNDERRANDGADRRRSYDRRAAPIRLAEEFERRLAEMEEIARDNRRELELQFTRIAQIQADLDALRKSDRASGPAPSSRREYVETTPPGADRAADRPFATLPSIDSRRANPT